MISFIKEIIKIKKIEIEIRKTKISNKKLIYIFKRINLDNKGIYIKGRIFGEFKKFSPINGNICKNFYIDKIIDFFKKSKINNFSVLTDQVFFGGNYCNIPIITTKKCCCCLLRKDFLISTYQIYESIIIGSNVILIIVFILGKITIEKFLKILKKNKIFSILEIFNFEDLKKIYNKTKESFVITGINNRNLENFEFNNKSFKIINFLKKRNKTIIESHINSFKKIYFFKRIFDYFLIGEFFMKKI